MARPLLRGNRLQAARQAMGLTREGLATKLELSSRRASGHGRRDSSVRDPALYPGWPPRWASTRCNSLTLIPTTPPLADLRLLAGLATNEVPAPGVSVMTFVRLGDGRPGADPSVGVITAIAEVLGVDVPRVEAARTTCRV